MGRYIVDFAEFGQKLIIEVDGSQHGFEKGETADRVRDAHFWLTDSESCAFGTVTWTGIWTG
ncbi:MAG: DUF559 domain-containing protein [Parvibaculaceae bacterium]